MRIYTLFIIFLSALMLNGCLIDRIRQRLYYKQHTKKVQQYHKKTTIRKKVYVAQKRVYKPSKPTAPIYKEPKKRVKIVRKKVKKRRHYTKKIHKKHILVKEPYSISSNEADPELLGPQTTLESNPLKGKNLKPKKKKI